MFKYKISTLEAADALCDSWATKCVSLLSPKYAGFYKTTPKRLVVYFDDIDFMPRHGSKLIAPNRDAIAEVLNFTKSLTETDRLLVHCKEGIGRSPAMLMGILCQHGMTAQSAFDAVRHIRPQMWPNDIVVKLCDSMLGLNSALIGAVYRYKLEAKKRPLREFLELIDRT
jgi:predicted protein tyrosine phosphatase